LLVMHINDHGNLLAWTGTPPATSAQAITSSPI
jgi:hypothetical protein